MADEVFEEYPNAYLYTFRRGKPRVRRGTCCVCRYKNTSLKRRHDWALFKYDEPEPLNGNTGYFVHPDEGKVHNKAVWFATDRAKDAVEAFQKMEWAKIIYHRDQIEQIMERINQYEAFLEVTEYCENDVRATEEVFKARKGDNKK